MLKDRVITAILLLAGLLGAVFLLPAAGWMVLCAALCAAAAWEWGGLARFERPLRMLSSIVFGVTCLMVGFLAGAAARPGRRDAPRSAGTPTGGRRS